MTALTDAQAAFAASQKDLTAAEDKLVELRGQLAEVLALYQEATRVDRVRPMCQHCGVRGCCGPVRRRRRWFRRYRAR
jgi:hypothetical protein